MAIFLVSTYEVKPDKLKEHLAWGKSLVASMKEQSGLFKEVKTLRVYRQQSEGNARRYVAMWEFKSLADGKKWRKRLQSCPETSLPEDFRALIVPGTFSTSVWKPIKIMRRLNHS